MSQGLKPMAVFPDVFTNLYSMIKQLRDNGMLYSQAAQDSNMITMKVLCSQDDWVKRCLDLL